MKKHTFLLVCSTFFALGATISACMKDDPVLPTSGLVAHYPFDGDTQDMSSFKNNGTPTNVIYVPNRKNQDSSAVSFTGTGSYITVKHLGAISFGTSQDYTISCWVKYGNQLKTGASDNYILSKFYPATNYPFSLRVINQTHTTATSQGIWYSGRKDGNMAPCNKTSSVDGKLANDGNWHHIVVVKSGTTLTSYMDGNKINVASDATSCPTSNTAPLYIGCYYPTYDANKYWYDGALDDLRIYTQALSDTEIGLLLTE